jgi:hypothetical protein
MCCENNKKYDLDISFNSFSETLLVRIVRNVRMNIKTEVDCLRECISETSVNFTSLGVRGAVRHKTDFFILVALRTRHFTKISYLSEKENVTNAW